MAPRSLLVILFLLTLVSLSAVSWFGWRLLAQDAVVERQRSQDHLEQAADHVVAAMRTWLDAGDEQLAALGPVFAVTANSLDALPPVHLLYRSFPATDPEAPAEVFAEGEALEFQQGQPESAADWYGRLAKSGKAAVRAGALLRLSRVQHKLGREQQSRDAAQRLAGIPGVMVAGAPAELVARIALLQMTGEAREAIRQDLLRGRWPLTHGQFEFYWSQVAPNESAPRLSPQLEHAATLAWNERRREPSEGNATVWDNGQPNFLLWRIDGPRRILLVTTPAAVLKRAAGSEDALFAAVDSDGRVVAGERHGEGHAAIRTAAESHLPWAIYVSSRKGHMDADLAAHRRFLLSAMAVMFVFLISGTYFIARAIRREMAVARLQSDFVSAVSHEFRSPLTSIRQLSELLVLGRVPSEERRGVYYRTLVKETERLQRLIEKLLNFGGIEAGKRQYHFEAVDTGDLVEHVAAEFAPQLAGSGRRIELRGTSCECRIVADREALSIALRNLVDNALKYSPEIPDVWVEWERAQDRVAIRVRDRGPGISRSERKAIFHKFVRGTAAASGGVKGMGVGLAMVRHIVAAHGGEIQLASEPGSGSTFTLLLPAVKQT